MALCLRQSSSCYLSQVNCDCLIAPKATNCQRRIDWPKSEAAQVGGNPACCWKDKGRCYAESDHLNMDSVSPPKKIRLPKLRNGIFLQWAGEHEILLTARQLRESSPSASAKRQRLNSGAVPLPPDISIVAVREIGSYAINITFSDGHDRGIFPWAFLKELSEVQ